MNRDILSCRKKKKKAAENYKCLVEFSRRHYSPLGRGFLAGRFKSPDDFDPDDFRRNSPRFKGENFQRNLHLADKVKEMATEAGISASQLALASVLAQEDHIVPIPGTKRRKYLEDNAEAVDAILSNGLLERLSKEFPPDAAAGERYAPELLHLLNR